MLFTEQHDMFRQMVRDFVEREINPHVEEWERAGSFPAHELFSKMGQLGLLGLEYEEAYGGQHADHGYSVVLGEETGRIDCGAIPMAVGVQTNMATPSLHRFGAEELKARFLVPAIRGEAVAAIAVTEPDAGSDVAAIRTRAIRDGDDWVINGTKIYVTNGVQADWLCLLARTSGEGGYRGMSQIVVPTSTPGVRVSRKLEKLGMWSSDTAELSFDDARVPVANTIGEIGRGFQQQMRQFEVERMIACYQSVGSMTKAIERTAAYLAERKVFGTRLIDREYIRYRLAELAVEVDAFRHYTYAAAEAMIGGHDTRWLTSACKLKSGRLLRQVSDTCIQFHGGIGYMAETWTSRYYRDSRLQSIGGGADEVMLQVLARLKGWDRD